MSERTIRIGVDVGGTFTDFVLHDPRRDLVHTGKLLTTPDDPSEAIVTGIVRLLKEKDIQASELHSIVHGTTLVTNTVIERTGADRIRRRHAAASEIPHHDRARHAAAHDLCGRRRLRRSENARSRGRRGRPA